MRWACNVALLLAALVSCAVSQFPMRGGVAQPNPFGAQDAVLMQQEQQQQLQHQQFADTLLSGGMYAPVQQMPSFSHPSTRSFNRQPPVSVDDAVNEFMAQQSQMFQQQQRSRPQSNPSGVRDLEEVEEGTEGHHNSRGPGVHAAVPKLQHWLSAMDPMKYSAPTFTNPVARQFFDKMADPSVGVSERDRLQRVVSSPYMFNMLGNPAYEDPQLWSGLVSGAAVPYPMRNTIFAQRTKLPFHVAATGDAMTERDHVSMKEYTEDHKEELGEGVTPTPFQPNHHTKRRLHHIFQVLSNHARNQRATLEPTPHQDLLDSFVVSPKKKKSGEGDSHEEDSDLRRGGEASDSD